jgi:glycosyltransferase involved in cell wall biosynthesis
MRLFWRALKAKAQVYHFHDPELIPLGIFLKMMGKKVIYDIHEDYPDAISHKQWIPKSLRKIFSVIFNAFEKKCCSFFDALIFAESTYKEQFQKIKSKKEDILNYPLPYFQNNEQLSERETINLIYSGTISEIRGAKEMVKAFSLLYKKGKKVHLYLVGPVSPPALEKELREMISFYGLQANVTLTGRVTPLEVFSYYARSDIGLALLHPVENNLKSLVTKLFEYMAAGLPIVASNFPRWEDLLAETGSGVTVCPFDPQLIASQLEYLIDNPTLRVSMGEKGREAFEKKYNWQSEEVKLLALYEKLAP